MAIAAPGNRVGYFDSVRSYFPTGTKALRACIQCRVIMEKTQFVDLGCPQCPELKMQENETRVINCTTQNFEGIMANIRPGGFSTRFTGLEKRMPGFYALIVRGEIPPPMDDMDMDLPGLVRDGSESPSPARLEEELFPDRPSKPKLPKAKKARTESSPGSAQPPSRDSSASEAAPDRLLKALDFGSDSEASDAEARAKADQVTVSASERTGTSHSETDARSRRPKDQTVPSGSERTGTSHSETDARGRPKDQIIPSASERTGTSHSETDASKRAKEAAQNEGHSSANESQRSGKSARSQDSKRSDKSGKSAQSHDSKQSDKSRKSAQSAQSGKTATSERSRSVAIIEPEVDTEFDRAPE